MNVAVVGLGLIGGSIARGLANNGFAACVYGIDSNESALELALEKEIIQGRLNPQLHGPEISIWIVATPPSSVPEWLEVIAHHATEQSVVTDVASAKGYLKGKIPEAIKSKFVGGHPLAGLPKLGLEASHPDLFEGQPWIICQGEATSEAVRRVTMLIHALDSDPVLMTEEEHDQHVAMISHLPHLLAGMLVRQHATDQYKPLYGPSWSNWQAMVASNPKLWAEICSENRGSILDVLNHFRTQCDQLASYLESNDRDQLLALFQGQGPKS